MTENCWHYVRENMTLCIYFTLTSTCKAQKKNTPKCNLSQVWLGYYSGFAFSKSFWRLLLLHTVNELPHEWWVAKHLEAILSSFREKQILRPSGFWIFYNAQGLTFTVLAVQNAYFSSYIALQHHHKYWANTDPVSISTKVKDNNKKCFYNAKKSLYCKKKKKFCSQLSCTAAFSAGLMKAVWVWAAREAVVCGGQLNISFI